MPHPFVSVIIVNWNGRIHLEVCLDSLLKQTYPNFEIILVDNASTDDSVSFVRQKYYHPGHKIQIIQNETNLGFAGGNNRGIRAAKDKYILLLNNDTEVHEKWIEELVNAAEKDSSIGMCASKILSFYNRNIIDVAGHLLYRDGLNRGRGRLEEDHGQYDKMEEALFPSGCAALYRKKMLDKIGRMSSF